MPPSDATETPQDKAARSRRAKSAKTGGSLRLGKGRGQGRVGVEAKEQLRQAFVKLGDVAGLVKWGKQNPTEFYRIWARLIPKEDNVNVTAVGVEELLAQLDEAERDAAGRLESMDAAGLALGLHRPTSDESGTDHALHVIEGGKSRT